MSRRPHKDVRRAKVLRRKQQYQEAVANLRLYPDIEVEVESSVPSELATATHAAARAVRKGYEAGGLTSDALAFLLDMARNGADRAVAETPGGEIKGLMRSKTATVAVAMQIFEQHPEHLVRSHLPVHCPWLDVDKRKLKRFLLQVRSLTTRKTPVGTAYSSHRRPKVPLAAMPTSSSSKSTLWTDWQTDSRWAAIPSRR